ncbi:MAG: hypothetical protein KDC66_14590, partial [Phaeodactylibacter sp.]|nr:hypothetical protein [Phaeodactylibacter sp.]
VNRTATGIVRGHNAVVAEPQAKVKGASLSCLTPEGASALCQNEIEATPQGRSLDQFIPLRK